MKTAVSTNVTKLPLNPKREAVLKKEEEKEEDEEMIGNTGNTGS
jgi:hypothetical protein